MPKPRIFILANANKPQVHQALQEIMDSIRDQARIVGSSFEIRHDDILSSEADFLIVLGGDGTILAVARAIADHPIPIIGVNLGKLGFLAEFSVGELADQFHRAVNDPEMIGERMILQVHRAGRNSLAINDVCMIAGPPFRMIEMECYINGQQLTRMIGDGLIISTPTGSTAYNMSVGGPIVLPRVQAIVVSPVAPHSLSLTPIVAACDSIVEVKMVRVNSGSTLLLDGQMASNLEAGDVIRVQRHRRDFMLVHNPKYDHWHTLVTKLRWGQHPSYNATDSH